MDNTQKPTSYLIDSLLQLLVEKNPVFETEKERYRAELTEQFETYLMSQMMNLLTEEKYTEFSNLLTNEPFAKEKHNEFLAENVENFSDKILEFSQKYLASYKEFINNMK